MSKKTIMAAGVLIATAAGGVISGVPASAQVPADGGASHSRSKFWQHNRNRNWNGDDNKDFNHIRAHVHNRNNDVAVARAPARNDVNAAACLDSAVQGNSKFVGITRNGQLLIQEVTLTPDPAPTFWQNATGAFTATFPGFTPVCVTLAVMGNNLHVTALGADGRVLQTACTINPPLTQFPESCGPPIDLGVPAAAAFSARAANRPARATSARASRGAIGHNLGREAPPVRAARH